jgi:hypothetical protein
MHGNDVWEGKMEGMRQDQAFEKEEAPPLPPPPPQKKETIVDVVYVHGTEHHGAVGAGPRPTMPRPDCFPFSARPLQCPIPDRSMARINTGPDLYHSRLGSLSRKSLKEVDAIPSLCLTTPLYRYAASPAIWARQQTRDPPETARHLRSPRCPLPSISLPCGSTTPSSS